MESFFNSFLPNVDGKMNVDHPTALPPEPQAGNVEYKLKIVNPSKQRFQHLVTQMKWRLKEGHGEAIYEIGVLDNGVLIGLTSTEMKDSLQTLNQMAIKLDARTSVMRKQMLDTDKMVCEILIRKISDEHSNNEIRVAVLGNADAGKSTLIGVLTQGHLDNGRGRARLNMFRHLHEVQSGRTSSISHEILGFNSQGEPINYSDLMTAEEICDASSKLVSFLDLAGHRKYINTTIQGLSGYSPHYVMLIISSTTGAIGMTQEHLTIALALNLPFFIVINKIDLKSVNDTLNNLKALLQQVGSCHTPLIINGNQDVINACSNETDKSIPIFYVSCVNGNGLDLLLKYLYLLQPITKSVENENLQPEFQIDEHFLAGDIQIFGGLVIEGIIKEGMDMQIGPFKNGTFEPVRIKSIHRNRVPCRKVRAGQSAAIAFHENVDNVRNGMVLLSRNVIKFGCMLFQANITVKYHPTSISSGYQIIVHIGNIRQTAVIVGMFGVNSISTNETATVMFKFKYYPEYVKIGQKLFFREGSAKGIGEITQVFSTSMQN